MAARLPEPEPWCRVAAVLAEAAGRPDETRPFDSEAQVQAKRMRGVRYDWAGKPCIIWTMAAELLASLQAEQARRQQAIEARLVEQAEAYMASIPKGVPLDAVPAGVSAGEWMMRADPDWQRRQRRSVVHDALENGGGLTYYPLNEGGGS